MTRLLAQVEVTFSAGWPTLGAIVGEVGVGAIFS